ncbi:MAG: hypothetical protein R3F56_16725 [Planctomycetota bacterium]
MKKLPIALCQWSRMAATAVLAMTAGLPAQGPACGTWSTAQTVVAAGNYSLGGTRHTLAFAPGKKNGKHTTWCLARDDGASRLFLRRSDDGGDNWQNTDSYLQTSNQTNGFIAMGNDCKTLHVLFDGVNSSGYSSVYYHAWDTTTGWIGTPTTIADGASVNWQYNAFDIEVTAKGRVVIAYSCAQPTDPLQPWFNSWWSCVLRVAPPPAEGSLAVFGPGTPVNQLPREALNVNLHAVGECVHVAFHSTETSGTSEIYYRAFDANSGWKHGNVSLGPEAQEAAVVPSITTDDECGACDYRVYILFASRAFGSGQIWLGHAQASLAGSSSNWSNCLVDNDPPILANTHQNHFSLANGEDRGVSVVYSKRGESFRNLYERRYFDGVCNSTTCNILLTNVNNRFRYVSGGRSSLVMSHPYVCVSGTDSVELFHDENTARTVGFGRYTGLLHSVPRLNATNTPTALQSFCVTICDAPPNLPGILFFGTTCIPQVDLFNNGGGIFGQGSWMMQNWLQAIPYSTVACARNSFWKGCFDIPGTVLKGESVYLQAAQVIDPAPLTLVPTNSMAVIFDW